MKNRKKWKLSPRHWQVVAALLMGYDAAAIVLAWAGALYCRFDFHYEEMMAQYGQALVAFLPIYTIASILVYYGLKLYKSIWRFSSFWELEHILYAQGICLLLALGISLGLTGRMPVSFYIFGILFQGILTGGLRFLYRFVLLLREARANHSRHMKRERAMIIGAGAAGQMLLHDSKRSGSKLEVCCIVDDNPNKHKRVIDGVPVKGGREDIARLVQEYQIDTILFAIPSAAPADKRAILNICQETGCRTKSLPSLIQMASQDVEISRMQDIKMEDLLGREPIQVDMEGILSSLTNKVILVTGGGGSIGSELCRQIASHLPRQLIIVDIYENNAYEIQNELRRKYPDLNLKVIIASVRDSRRISEIFETYRPQIVYHAAAHKHVPLMEVSPCESIKNNVFGTYKTARAALENGAERFVLISTDKAVHPTNIMGASKRLCEMVIQTMNDVASGSILAVLPNIGHPISTPVYVRNNVRTQFVAVRFGNVLGSNGSVIPLFEKQIENGGPVTVTHPEITRFFMTIPEAVSLVLQAGTYARGGEIFVLDMGEPVKIDDLAHKLIRLSGHTPGEDIKIQYTGLRPGEKLYEEKLMAEEGLEKTPNKLIHIGKPIDFDRGAFLASLPDLYRTCMRNDEAETILEVRRLVSTYTPDWNSFEQNGITFRWDSRVDERDETAMAVSEDAQPSFSKPV